MQIVVERLVHKERVSDNNIVHARKQAGLQRARSLCAELRHNHARRACLERFAKLTDPNSDVPLAGQRNLIDIQACPAGRAGDPHWSHRTAGWGL